MDDPDDKPRHGDKPRRFGKKRFLKNRPRGGESRRANHVAPLPGRAGEEKYRPRGARDSRPRFARESGRDGESREAGGGAERPFRKFEGRAAEGGFRKDFRSRGGKNWPRKERGGGGWRGGVHRPRGDEFVHQRDLVRIAGSKAVKALFAHAPDRVERLFFSREMKEETVGYCRVLAKARRVFREAAPEELARVAGTPMHGGIVAVARPKPVRAFDPAEAARWAAAARLLPILHGVANPHNLGAIARTAAFLGLPRLVLTDHPAQAGLSDAALRVAEGGFEILDVYRAANLADTLRRLKESHRVLGAAPGRGLTPERIPRDRPIALVFGNEEQGLDAATLAACDEAVTIPGAGAGPGGSGVQSLNVSVAAGILLYMLKPPAESR